MYVSDKDIKKLWGLSAGKCNYPGCPNDCILVLDSEDTALVGEMAHVIAESPEGPRGDGKGGDNSYENLILLCPYHHRLVDKAPEHFSRSLILDWKKNHESRIGKALSSVHFENKIQLFSFVRQILIENKITWENYGPESKEAKKNPYSNLSEIWIQKKVDTIIPNNSKIIEAISNHKNLLDTPELEKSFRFISHAKAFEFSCFTRTEGVPRFPTDFEEMING